MATLVDRLIYTNDYDTDGGIIDIPQFDCAMACYVGGLINAATFKTWFSMTTVQGNQLDTILATRPAAPLLLLNVPAYVQWAAKVVGIFKAAQSGFAYTTVSAANAALGI